MLLSVIAEWFLKILAVVFDLFSRRQSDSSTPTSSTSTLTLAETDPTTTAIVEQPYSYYRRLRDEAPVFRPLGQDYYCISRYADIQQVAKQTELYSSNIVDVLLNTNWGQWLNRFSQPSFGQPSQHNWGVAPVDVLAVQDRPAHKYQKLLTHRIMSGGFVTDLEPDVRKLATELLDGIFLTDRSDNRPAGEVEFMQAVAWRLPMLMAMRLVGYPEADYDKIKYGCAQAIRLLSGTVSPAQFARHSAAALTLYRYCWQQYLIAKKNPGDDISGNLARGANDAEHPITDEEAVSILFQLLIAGSDSSASTMGNAVRLLIENPELADRLRHEPDRIPDFIEEVLRLESAFQGHFRVLTEDAELHDISLAKGSRLFLLWASGNRDERFWERPDEIDINRPNRSKHLTFGYGLHACLGRELARMEIRIVLEELLARTESLSFAGETSHVASLFTRTLETLPIRLHAT